MGPNDFTTGATQYGLDDLNSTRLLPQYPYQVTCAGFSCKDFQIPWTCNFTNPFLMQQLKLVGSLQNKGRRPAHLFPVGWLLSLLNWKSNNEERCSSSSSSGFNFCFRLIIASLEIYLVGLELIQNITV